VIASEFRQHIIARYNLLEVCTEIECQRNGLPFAGVESFVRAGQGFPIW